MTDSRPETPRALASLQSLGRRLVRADLGEHLGEHLGGALGWLGGAATVYGPVSLVVALTAWAVIGAVRFAGPRLLGGSVG